MAKKKNGVKILEFLVTYLEKLGKKSGYGERDIWDGTVDRSSMPAHERPNAVL